MIHECRRKAISMNSRKTILSVLLLMLVLCTSLQAETADDADSLYDEGTLLLEQVKPREALEKFKEGLAICERLKDRKLAGDFLCAMGDAYTDLYGYHKALECYQKSLRISHELGIRKDEGDTLHQMSIVYYYSDEYQKSMECCTKALKLRQSLGDTAGEAHSFSQMASIFYCLGDYQKAFECCQKSIAISRKTGEKRGEADSLDVIGSIYNCLGDYTKSLEYHRKSLRLSEESGNKEGECLAIANIGATYQKMGDSAKALDYARKALKLSQEIDDRQAQCASLNDIGMCYSDLGKYDSALDHIEKALKKSREIGDRIDEANSLFNLGSIYCKKGDFLKSLDYFGKAFTIYRAVGDPDGMLWCSISSGFSHEELGNDDRAIESLIASARLIESMRGRLSVEEHKTGFMKDKVDFYESLIHLLIKKGRRDEAWSYAESAKARTFLDMLGNHKIDFRVKADPDLVRRAEELEKALSAKRALLFREDDEMKRKELSSRIESLQKDYEDMLERLKLSNPDYASLKTIEVSSTEEIRGALDDDSLLLEYFVGEEKSYLFIMDKRDSLAVHELSLGESELKEKVSQLLGDIQRRAPVYRKGENEPGTKADTRGFALATPDESLVRSKSIDGQIDFLSRTLLGGAAKALEGKKKLIIIPHGPLHYLPFSLLIDEQGRYLVMHYQILTEPSATIWKLCSGKKKRKDGRLAAFALGDFSVALGEEGCASLRGTPEMARNGFPPLPGTRKEVEAISHLFPDRVIIMGREMTSARVGEAIKGKSIIHFATHGILDAQHPMFSGLLVSDRILTIADIFGMDIDADLVVLSACNTALGGKARGEEIVGISRAFMYAGSSTVIASLWSVSDDSTMRIMKIFYEGLQQGMPEAEALQFAEISVKKDYPHPFYWAPFIIVGASR
jgi:tetratricopeptide (TPR) repeat protein